MSTIEKNKKIGEGAYGIVYEGKLINNDKEIKVAIKRNYGDEESIGISSLREMNFLALLKHPCITRLKTISIGDPFQRNCPMTPRPKRNDMREDSHHFVLEYADKSLEDFYLGCDNFYQLKIIICQILLALEFIHGKGILHRDLKPGNVLINMEEEMPYAKLCDFGLTCYPSNYRPSTPGAVTSWYRSPEICCEYDDYSFPSDIWSAGCIFYEIVTKKPLIQTRKDESKNVFKEIINKIPQYFTSKYVDKYIARGDCPKFKHGFTEKLTPEKIPFLERLRRNIDIDIFNKEGGSSEDFANFLDCIFVLDPNKRFSAKKCLDHKFFDPFRPFIEDMRNKYPPIKDNPYPLKIIDCLERRWAVNIAYKIYNSRSRLKWYSDHIIFHSIRLFDEYISRFYTDDNPKLRKSSKRGLGRLNTEQEINLYFYTCIYISYKYFSTLYQMYTWDKIFPKNISIHKHNIKKIEDFEKFMLKHICKYVVFRPTLIECLSDDYCHKGYNEKQLDIRKFLINYGNIEMNYEGTMEDLYFQIKDGLKK